MQERRKELRMQTLKVAKIALNDHASAIACTVSNLSLTGACLEVASPISVPETFDLIFDADKYRHPCRIIWRDEKRVGIEFL
jgi:hypothetical protein